MKQLLVFLAVLSGYFFRAQAIVIEEEFNGGTTAPTGWVFTSIGSSLSSNSNYGKSAPSVVMDASNDQITSATFVAGSANTVSFWAQASGAPAAGDLLTVEYFNGSWNSASPATFTLNTTSRVFEATIATTATRVRITYTKVTSGVNADIDDFTVLSKTGTCTANSFLWFSSIAYNSCNVNTCEGTDEFLTFQNGSTALNLADLEINVPTVGNGPEGTTFCGSSLNPCDEYFTTNAAYVSALNGVTGCTGFFLSPPGNVIPANGRVIVFMGTPPSTTVNFGNLCGTGGNYYCVFVSNTANCAGRYSNNSTTPRYTTIRNRSTGCSVERYFVGSLGNNLDGDIVDFDPTGAATYVSNAGCSGFVALPITLISFTGVSESNKIGLTWEVAEQKNTRGYMIEKSIDARTWTKMLYIDSNNESNTDLTYSAEDRQPVTGINYYRLTDIDSDGQSETHQIISVNFAGENQELYFTQTEEMLLVNSKLTNNYGVYDLFDLSGRLIRKIQFAGSNTVSIPKRETGSGMFLIKCSDCFQSKAVKLIIY